VLFGFGCARVRLFPSLPLISMSERARNPNFHARAHWSCRRRITAPPPPPVAAPSPPVAAPSPPAALSPSLLRWPPLSGSPRAIPAGRPSPRLPTSCPNRPAARPRPQRPAATSLTASTSRGRRSTRTNCSGWVWTKHICTDRYDVPNRR
jgi:hypothetical protein